LGSVGTGGVELGDARRTRRLIKLVDDLSAQPTGSIPLACGGWSETKAAYRLLDNPAVEWREILEVHTQRTVERLAGQSVVLCIQDTTELDFTTQPGIAGLGRLSDEAQHGLYVLRPWWSPRRERSWACWMLGCGRANPKTNSTSRKAPVGWRATRLSPIWPRPYPTPDGSTWRIGKATCGR